ncbi:MAG TPA: methyltransferase domain-containing protein [Candidatus Acidoferrales bacterium]
MPSLIEDWDARYREPARPLPDRPAAILAEVLPLLPRGRALDIACGAGGNAIFLAMRGWDVTAVDFSSAALALACSAAQAAGIRAAWERTFAEPPRQLPGLHLIDGDLEKLSLPRQAFNLILCTNYLQRSLFRQVEAALRGGGVLLYETFTRDQLQFAAGPRNREFLLNPGELRESFPDLTTLFYREMSAGKGIASILARKTS